MTIVLKLFQDAEERCDCGHKSKGQDADDDIIGKCTHLQRLSVGMKYLSEMTERYGIDIAGKRLTDFVEENWTSITDDYIHFIRDHGNDLLQIAECLRKKNPQICDIRKCASLRRQCGRNRTANMVKSNKSEHIDYYRSILDRFHHMVFHLYALGLRFERNSEMKMDDEVGPNEVDEVLQEERDLVAQKNKEFNEAAPDLVENDEAQNKFMIGAESAVKECATDGIHREIGKKYGKEPVSDMNSYRVRHDFDSDAVEDDVAKLEDSNLYSSLKHKPSVKLLKDLVVKIQSMWLLHVTVLLIQNDGSKHAINRPQK